MSWDDIGGEKKLDEQSSIHLHNIRWALKEIGLTDQQESYFKSFEHHLSVRGQALTEAQLRTVHSVWDVEMDWANFDDLMKD